jgi:hypothetical protein
MCGGEEEVKVDFGGLRAMKMLFSKHLHLQNHVREARAEEARLA